MKNRFPIGKILIITGILTVLSSFMLIKWGGQEESIFLEMVLIFANPLMYLLNLRGDYVIFFIPMFVFFQYLVLLLVYVFFFRLIKGGKLKKSLKVAAYFILFLPIIIWIVIIDLFIAPAVISDITDHFTK